jgi:hypothetical protein
MRYTCSSDPSADDLNRPLPPPPCRCRFDSMRTRTLVIVAASMLPLPFVASALAGDTKPTISNPAYEVPTDDPAVADAGQNLLAFIATPELAGNGVVAYARDPDRLQLFWPGEPPTAVIVEVERIRRSGVAVEVLPALHAASELDEEAARLRGLDPEQIGFTLTSVGPLGDLSGLHVGVRHGDIDRARAYLADGRFHYKIIELEPTPAAG